MAACYPPLYCGWQDNAVALSLMAAWYIPTGTRESVLSLFQHSVQSWVLSLLQTHQRFSFDLGKGTELGHLERACSGCWARVMNSRMQGPTHRNLQPEKEEDFSTFVAGLVSREWQKVVVALDKERPSDKGVNGMGASFCSCTLPN